jgi:hypothetical protein
MGACPASCGVKKNRRRRFINTNKKNKNDIDNYGVEPTYCEAGRSPALFEPEFTFKYEFGSGRVQDIDEGDAANQIKKNKNC